MKAMKRREKIFRKYIKYDIGRIMNIRNEPSAEIVTHEAKGSHTFRKVCFSLS